MKMHEFNDIRGLIDSIRPQDYRSSANDFINNNLRESWAGITGKDQYMQYLKDGYTAGVEQLEAELSKAEGQAFRFIPSVSGIFYDVSAFVEDRPECMATFAAIEENVFISININTSTPFTTSGEELMKKAAAIFNAVNTCEAGSARCKITICTGVKIAGREHIVKILVKDYQDTLITGYHGLLLANHGTTRGAIYSYLSQFSKHYSIGSPVDYNTGADIEISMNKNTEVEILQKILAGGQSGI